MYCVQKLGKVSMANYSVLSYHSVFRLRRSLANDGILMSTLQSNRSARKLPHSAGSALPSAAHCSSWSGRQLVIAIIGQYAGRNNQYLQSVTKFMTTNHCDHIFTLSTCILLTSFFLWLHSCSIFVISILYATVHSTITQNCFQIKHTSSAHMRNHFNVRA